MFYTHQVINRSAKYKNKYVHRRDSVSLANFTLQELQAQADLGLIVHPDSEEDEVRLTSSSSCDERLLTPDNTLQLYTLVLFVLAFFQ